MNFLKTIKLSGLFILLPLMLLWTGLKELVQMCRYIARPVDGDRLHLWHLHCAGRLGSEESRRASGESRNGSH
jgi:hypothetical protein